MSETEHQDETGIAAHATENPLDATNSTEESETQANAGSTLVHYKEVLPTTLPILPLLHRPFFPGQAVPLVVEGEPWKQTIEMVVASEQKMLGLVLLKDANLLNNSSDHAQTKDFYTMGTACRLHRVAQSDDKLQIMVEGLQRFRIETWISQQPPFIVQPHYYPEPRYEDMEELKPYVLAIINTIRELLPLNPLYGEELKIFLERFAPDDPSHLADFAASLTTSNAAELQIVLETVPLLKRVEKVLTLLNKELQTAKTQTEIRKQVEEKMEKQHREFLLHEQLKTIQKELGLEKDDRTAELEKFQKRLHTLQLTPEAEQVVKDEMDKLKMLEPGSAEYNVSRNYLDWLSLLPWGKYSADKLNIKSARKVLDGDHEGLEDVKQRIIEFIGVGNLKGSIQGTILLLVGPPGVGKTSIGRSVANAIGREFYRFSIGGMRDEAEIKGHRRTYIGAMPGKFVQAMKSVGSANPVIMLDEIDKIGASYHGDPASALLEVLDPEQNVDFLDHYMDVRFDLSKVFFICTANQLDTIPAALLDRMEVINLSGYLTSEKVQIAKKHLLRRQFERNGLERTDVRISDKILCKIIENYAREAGVRNLEKRLGIICRKCAVKILEGAEKPIKITEKNLADFLGKAVFENEHPLQGTGIVTGLAWTAMGGATLSIEVNLVHSYTRGFKLTGQLGEVMRESAEIAYSYVVSQCKALNIAEHFFENAFIHVHVPAGATPKDGPSAGITMASALVSLARRQPPQSGFAMTGELTLTGEVLPIGGVREKVIAARRVNIYKLILPKANQGDFEALPDYIREGIEAHFVGRYEQVFKLLF